MGDRRTVGVYRELHVSRNWVTALHHRTSKAENFRNTFFSCKMFEATLKVFV